MRPQLQTCRNPTWRVEMKMEREAEPKMYDATRHGAGTPFACNRENTCRAWATCRSGSNRDDRGRTGPGRLHTIFEGDFKAVEGRITPWGGPPHHIGTGKPERPQKARISHMAGTHAPQLRVPRLTARRPHILTIHTRHTSSSPHAIHRKARGNHRAPPKLPPHPSYPPGRHTALTPLPFTPSLPLPPVPREPPLPSSFAL